MRCALALLCAAAVVACARAYTVDCNPEFTDCESEMKKITQQDMDHIREVSTKAKTPTLFITPTTSQPTTTQMPTTIKTTTETKKQVLLEQEALTTEKEAKQTADIQQKFEAKPRLLNLNVDELNNFASALHNTTHSKIGDLSDVNLDDEDYEPVKPQPNKEMQDKFFTNLQAPFHPLYNNNNNNNNHQERLKYEDVECKENNAIYKLGEKTDRGCDEICECTHTGYFECTPRCKHPYIRRGRKLNDPQCFESPVDECCSIVACATGGGQLSPNRHMEDIQIPNMNVLPPCVHANKTYHVGATWNVDCQQKCSCETNSKVLCVPRCKPLPPSDKCINVPDPVDDCCEIHVCDVSQDDHEGFSPDPNEDVLESHHHIENMTTRRHDVNFKDEDVHKQMIQDIMDLSKTSTLGPLVLNDPIDSVDILYNNSVQVNLQRPNSSSNAFHLLLSDDGGKTFKNVELVYDNLILNLEPGKEYILRTVETGTNYNFTVGQGENDKFNSTGDGCWSEGKYYATGEEFHIGCSELCECMGNNKTECAALVCPNHVGLELVSKGCVRWAPTPPVTPPNCCPRTARCLSDGTCHFNGTAIPNWSEVPIALTGCERRCFCENGELDCQEVCTPLPKIPPPTFRCPPTHRPAPVNISDEDCCQQWGCLPKAQIDIFRMMPSIEPVPLLTLPSVTFSAESVDLSPQRTVPYHLPPTSVLPTPPTTTEQLFIEKTMEYQTITTNLPPVIIPENSMLPHKGKTTKIINLNGPTFRKTLKSPGASTISNTSLNPSKTLKNDWDQNITVVTLDDSETPIKTIYPEHSLRNLHNQPHLVNTYDKKVMPVAYGVNQVIPVQQNCSVISLYPLNDVAFRPVSKLRLKGYYVDKLQEHPMQTMKPESAVYNDSLDLDFPDPNAMPLPVTSLTTPTSIATKTNDLYIPTGRLLKFKALKPKYLRLPQSLPASPYFTPYVRKYNVLLRESRDEPENNATRQHSTHSNVNLTIVSNENNEESMETEDTRGINILNKEKSEPFKEPFVTTQNSRYVGKQASIVRTSAEKDEATQVAGNANLNPSLGNLRPQQPAFLPTVPPDSIQFPEDPEPDYDQNNVHRPGNQPQEQDSGIVLPGMRVPAHYGDENRKLVVISLVADSPTSVKMLFGLPPVLVGLRGSVDLRYTDEPDIDISLWSSQVFAPADEVLTTPRLEFRLTGLKPSTVYKIRGKLFLHNLPVEPESDVHTIRTLDLPTVPLPPEEKRREIDSRLSVIDANDTTAHVSWRRFTEEELKYIDGIQVRFRPVGTPIFSMTELLHHSRSNAELQDLRPGLRYEASLVLIPPPNTLTELHDPSHVEFNTAPYIDPYNFTVTIEARSVGSQAAEITWSGVPVPAERWVRVYRAAHTCGGSRKEHDEFRLATRDVPPALTLAGLEPDSRCRIWLELFLSNGKIKTSNVLELNTKPVEAKEEVDNMVEASSSLSAAGAGAAARGDYYGSLVAAGVVAALGLLAALLLLLLLLRRHRPRSVPITPVPNAPRESSLPPYDNPAYKLELQQETMDL